MKFFSKKETLDLVRNALPDLRDHGIKEETLIEHGIPLLNELFISLEEGGHFEQMNISSTELRKKLEAAAAK